MLDSKPPASPRSRRTVWHALGTFVPFRLAPWARSIPPRVVYVPHVLTWSDAVSAPWNEEGVESSGGTTRRRARPRRQERPRAPARRRAPAPRSRGACTRSPPSVSPPPHPPRRIATPPWQVYGVYRLTASLAVNPPRRKGVAAASGGRGVAGPLASNRGGTPSPRCTRHESRWNPSPP